MESGCDSRLVDRRINAMIDVDNPRNLIDLRNSQFGRMTMMTIINRLSCSVLISWARCCWAIEFIGWYTRMPLNRAYVSSRVDSCLAFDRCHYWCSANGEKQSILFARVSSRLSSATFSKEFFVFLWLRTRSKFSSLYFEYLFACCQIEIIHGIYETSQALIKGSW